MRKAALSLCTLQFGNTNAPISRWPKRNIAPIGHHVQILKNRKIWKKHCLSHGPHRGGFHRDGIGAEHPLLRRSRLKRIGDFVIRVREMEGLQLEQTHT